MGLAALVVGLGSWSPRSSSPECPSALHPGPGTWFLILGPDSIFPVLLPVASSSRFQAHEGLGALAHPMWGQGEEGFEFSLPPGSPVQVGVTESLQMSSFSTTYFMVLGECLEHFSSPQVFGHAHV